MLDQRDQAKAKKPALLRQIRIAIATEQLRKSVAEANEAENRVRNQDHLEKADIKEAESRRRETEERTRDIRHRMVRGWAVAVAAIVLTVLSGYPEAGRILPTGAVSGGIDPTSPSPAPDSPFGQEAEKMMGKAKAVGNAEHLSSSRVQRETEMEIIERLGGQLGVDLRKARVRYHDSVMEIDGVTDDGSVFAEAFARIGPFKSGQFRKVSTDALKLISLQASRPTARFILAFADQAAADSLKGWQVAVLDQHHIERIVVTLPPAMRRKLLVTQAKQKKGMES